MLSKLGTRSVPRPGRKRPTDRGPGVLICAPGWYRYTKRINIPHQSASAREPIQPPRVTPALVREQPREGAAVPRVVPLVAGAEGPGVRHDAGARRAPPRVRRGPLGPDRLRARRAAQAAPLPLEQSRVELDAVRVSHPRVHVLPESEQAPQILLPQPPLLCELHRAPDLPERRVEVPVQPQLPAGGLPDLGLALGPAARDEPAPPLVPQGVRGAAVRVPRLVVAALELAPLPLPVLGVARRRREPQLVRELPVDLLLYLPLEVVLVLFVPGLAPGARWLGGDVAASGDRLGVGVGRVLRCVSVPGWFDMLRAESGCSWPVITYLSLPR